MLHVSTEKYFMASFTSNFRTFPIPNKFKINLVMYYLFISFKTQIQASGTVTCWREMKPEKWKCATYVRLWRNVNLRRVNNLLAHFVTIAEYQRRVTYVKVCVCVYVCLHTHAKGVLEKNLGKLRNRKKVQLCPDNQSNFEWMDNAEYCTVPYLRTANTAHIFVYFDTLINSFISQNILTEARRNNSVYCA
jgi:hypothetical protein